MKKLYPGEQGVFVQYLQLALQRAGESIAIDGIFGPDTCSTVEKFTGKSGGCTVDDETWKLLIPYLKGYTTHLVEKGDSIYSIAKKYGTTEQAVLQANPNVESNNLNIGTLLIVPFDFEIVPDNVLYTSFLVEWIVDGLQARYPYLKTGSLGRSVMGSELLYLNLGNGDTEVCYNASFHANESITTPVLLKFAEQLMRNYENEEEMQNVNIQHLFEEFNLYLIPMVNPDGVDLVNGALDQGNFYREAVRIASAYPDIPFLRGWKANIRGVDLNLQFPAGWNMAKQIKYNQGYTKPAPRDYVGMTPLSEPESIAMYNFTRAHEFRLILAYHTQGEVIYWRYLDYNPVNSHEIGKYFSEVSGYRLEETPSASSYAGYKDWFILEYDKPGYTIEAGLGTNPLPMSQFEKIYRDNIGILLGGMTELE